MSSVIACSGYINNEFIFISKNNNDRNNYHLNYVSGTNQTVLYSQPLSNLTGYPQNNNSIFGGLCSYSSKNASMYLSFESSGMISSSSADQAYNTTISSIYQLPLTGNGSAQLRKTPIELYNTTLFSFLYISDNNNTPNLAFIATTTTNPNGTQQQSTTTLNVMSLESPATYNTSMSISGPGIIAIGGNNSQSLYFIQSNTIDEYQLNTMKHSQSSIQLNININSIKPGTTGQVLSVVNPNNNNSTNEYISVYHPENAEIDIFNHDTSRSKYTPLPSIDGGYFSFSNNTLAKGNNTVNNSNHGTTTISSTAVSSSSAFSAITAISGGASKPSKSKSSSAPTSVETDPLNFRKRGLANESPIQSSEGAYSYRKANITSENGSPVPVAAALTTASSTSQDPPYNIVMLSGNDASGYNISEMTGAGSIVGLSDSRYAPGDLGGGAIAGIVIGVIVFIAIVAGLLYYTKKRKNDKGPKLRSYNSMPLSIQPDDFVSPYMVNRSMNNKDNDSNTSSILQESKYIPEEYHDGSRPDIRPLSYQTDLIDYAQLSNDELLKLEPDVEGPLFLFSGVYTSSAEERVTYLKDGYAIRTFDANDGNKHTIHYFSSANLDTFVRSVHAVIRSSAKQQGNTTNNNNYIMKHERAIVLNSPTPNFHYQYIWITSPMIPEHSLYHLLFERKKWTFVDHHNADYKIWSVYAILKSIETIHSHKFVHLAIDLKAFYYDHEMKATDWRLGNFGHAQSSLKTYNHQYNKGSLLPPTHNSFTAPEIITGKNNNKPEEAADIWSVGCVIYTIATGGQLLFENDIQVKNLVTFNNDMKQHLRIAIQDNIENDVFKNILEKMLQVDPNDRKSIIEILDYWNSIYNMEAE